MSSNDSFDKSIMLHDLTWLEVGQCFPPYNERARLDTYRINRMLFHTEIPEEYNTYISRITRVIDNFENIISFPIVFGYPKLMTLKMADLVCGEYPNITGKSDNSSDVLDSIREDNDFDAKMYSTVIDISRYGDAVWRLYKNGDKYTFTVWDPSQWYPVVSQDGTNTEIKHVLCWTENRGDELNPDWYLTAQIHEVGYYIEKVFKSSSVDRQILSVVSERKVPTGLSVNAVMHIRAFKTTDTVYGDDDYMNIDSTISELATRVSQVSTILDKHADPILTGPVSLLTVDPTSKELVFKPGKYFATQADDHEPKYLTWDGQLEASFKQMEFLVDQLYILSEMGSALAGARDSTFQAVSGAAMRAKMVTPLAKARRISNSLTIHVKKLLSILSSKGYPQAFKPNEISVVWSDGLPNDPRELLELAKLACGENTIMPIKEAIMRYLDITNKEAEQWIKSIDDRALEQLEREQANLDADDPEQKNAGPGPKKGQVASTKGSKNAITNVNPAKQN